MQSTSPAQFDASLSGVTPALERVRDDVWSLGLPMPGGHLPYSFLYLLRDAHGGVHVIDPGWDLDGNWLLFVEALEAIGSRLADVRSMLATHLHPDHLGMAARMREATGATLILHRAEQEAIDSQLLVRFATESLDARLDEWGVPADRRDGLLGLATTSPVGLSITADRLVDDGDRLDGAGFDLGVMWTPGHTNGSMSLRDDARGLLFTGDHLLPNVYPGLGLGGPTTSSPIADYLDSLARVSGYPAHEVLPGHGYRFTGVAERAAECAEHHLRRSREVAAVLQSGEESTIWGIASRLTWTAGWENLDGLYLYSGLLQTVLHVTFVEGARGTGSSSGLGFESPSRG